MRFLQETELAPSSIYCDIFLFSIPLAMLCLSSMQQELIPKEGGESRPASPTHTTLQEMVRQLDLNKEKIRDS